MKNVLCLLFSFFMAVSAFAQLKNLEIFAEDYPKAGYFRVAEFSIRQHYAGHNHRYEEWRDRMSDLSGIMGKTEYEELLTGNPYEQIYDWFCKFKRDYPEKFVMVHLNGRGRIPNYRLEKFSPGHWLYFEGSDVLDNLPSEAEPKYEKETWIRVKNPSCFRMDNGAKFKNPDDITLVRRNSDGTLDWEHAEYVRLLAVDGDRIKISRGMFGSEPLEFVSGETYAAPHIMGGPWGSTSNMVWYYNLSTECPKDKNGKTCADILVEEFSSNFAEGGRWNAFDGVQFDVMTGVPTTGYHERRKALGQRADVDMDGVQDDGIINGVQTFGLGCFDYLKRLREAVGPDKIIAADGREAGCQKAGASVLNGVEMEGVPEQRPYGYVTWSTTYNLLNLWKNLSFSPLFNYAAFRYKTPDKLSESELLNYYRLAFAQSVFTDSFILCNSWTTLKGIPEFGTIFKDETGAALSPGWLGKPLAGPEYYTDRFPDLLTGSSGLIFPENLFDKERSAIKFSTAGMNSIHQVTKKGITVAPLDKNIREFGFILENVPYNNGQAFVEITLNSSGASEIYPEGYTREMTVYSRGAEERYMKMLVTLTDDPFRYRLYFCDSYDYMTDETLSFDRDENGNIDMIFIVKDTDRPMEISGLSIKDAPEVIVRNFEHGTVVANLSGREIELKELKLTVPSKDAVFIKKK